MSIYPQHTDSSQYTDITQYAYNTEILNIKDMDKTRINVVFHEGYSFRNFIDFLKCSGQSASMIFSSNGIALSESDAGNTRLINVYI